MPNYRHDDIAQRETGFEHDDQGKYRSVHARHVTMVSRPRLAGVASLGRLIPTSVVFTTTSFYGMANGG